MEDLLKRSEVNAEKVRALGPNDPFIIHECPSDGVLYRRVWTTKSELRREFWEWYGDRPLKIGTIHNKYGCKIIDFYNVVSPSERPQWEAQQQQQAMQEQQQAMQGRSDTCKGFGFKENTEAHAQCMFDLFKLEQQSAAQQLAIQSQAAQNQAVQSQAASNAATQRALLQQQIDQQNFNQGIQLLQQSQQLLNPPRPTTNCQWYYATQTMRCR